MAAPQIRIAIGHRPAARKHKRRDRQEEGQSSMLSSHTNHRNVESNFCNPKIVCTLVDFALSQIHKRTPSLQ